MIMDIALNLTLLIFCFFVLIKGADFMVDAASYIAAFLGVPSLIIELTIVAFGTHCPYPTLSDPMPLTFWWSSDCQR